jgi:hypothetical protein
LYRHPSALRDPRLSFTKRHDYYALGLVLAEIGLWSSLQEILKNHSVLMGEECRESDVRKIQSIILYGDTMVDYLRDIAFNMGSIYRGVIEACLSGDFGVAQSASGDQLVSAFSEVVVAKLASCKV